MIRIEIISNKSVEEDIKEALEQYISDILYTTVPLTYGRGNGDYKMGTTTWPETNFMFISYINDGHLEKVKAVIKAVKQKFPDEGIKLFATPALEIN